MTTSKVNVDDDVIPEFDFSRAMPSPFRHLARKGMRFHIVTDGASPPPFTSSLAGVGAHGGSRSMKSTDQADPRDGRPSSRPLAS